jgi:hypothetical protein
MAVILLDRHGEREQVRPQGASRAGANTAGGRASKPSLATREGGER